MREDERKRKKWSEREIDETERGRENDKINRAREGDSVSITR